MLITFFYRPTHRLIHWSESHCRVKSSPFSIAGESNRRYGPSMAFRVIVSEAVCADIGAACLSNSHLPAPLALMHVSVGVRLLCLCLNTGLAAQTFQNLIQRQRFHDKRKALD